MHEVFLVSAARTPIGTFGQAFRDTPAIQLGASALSRAASSLSAQGLPIDLVFMGQAYQAGAGINPAFAACKEAGITPAHGAVTLNQGSGSGLWSLFLGAQAIASGQAGLVLAGGMECMSQVPYLLQDARWGQRMGASTALDALWIDGMPHPGIHDSGPNHQLPRLLENVQKAHSARESGHFHREIVPLQVRRGRKQLLIIQDEFPAPASPASHRNMAPTSGFSDGAAALLLSSKERCPVPPRARIRALAQCAGDPSEPTFGILKAVDLALARAKIDLHGLDCLEIHTASPALTWELQEACPAIPGHRVNPRGDAHVLGHPVGATGARLVVTLLHTLEDEDLRHGLVALQSEDGQGVALVLERLP